MLYSQAELNKIASLTSFADDSSCQASGRNSNETKGFQRESLCVRISKEVTRPRLEPARRGHKINLKIKENIRRKINLWTNKILNKS